MEQHLTGAIRQAVAAGDFPRATRLWNQYADGIQEEMRRGTCTTARLAEARELVEWARLTWLCARSHLQDRLNTIAAAERYTTPPSQVAVLFQARL